MSAQMTQDEILEIVENILLGVEKPFCGFNMDCYSDYKEKVPREDHLKTEFPKLCCVAGMVNFYANINDVKISDTGSIPLWNTLTTTDSQWECPSEMHWAKSYSIHKETRIYRSNVTPAQAARAIHEYRQGKPVIWTKILTT